MAPWTGSLVVRTQNANHMVVRGRAQILGHGFHRAIGSRKADDEGDRLFVLSGGKIVTVDALIGRTLHAERCKLKRRSLCQRIADARTVDINALGFLQKVVDAQHVGLVQRQPRIGDRLVIQSRNGVDDIRVRTLRRDRFIGQNLPDALILVDFRNQFELQFLISGQSELLTQANHGCLAGQRCLGKLSG